MRKQKSKRLRAARRMKQFRDALRWEHQQWERQIKRLMDLLRAGFLDSARNTKP